MKAMFLLLNILSALFLGVLSQANPITNKVVIHYAHCTSAEIRPDDVYDVNINWVVINSQMGHYEAIVEHNTIAGPVLFGTFRVEKLELPCLEECTNFRGKNFSLTLQPSKTNANGQFIGHLYTKNTNREVSEDLLCNYTR